MQQISLGFGKAHAGRTSVWDTWKMVSSVYWIKRSFTFPAPFQAMAKGEEDRALRAFVPTLADLYINAGWISPQSSGPLSVETFATLPPAPFLWLFEFINEGPQTWVISKKRCSPWVKSFLLTRSDSRLKVSLRFQALRSGECLKACDSSRDSTSTWPERLVTFLDKFKEHFRKKET